VHHSQPLPWQPSLDKAVKKREKKGKNLDKAVKKKNQKEA